MIRLSLLLLCCSLYCAVIASGQGSLSKCCTTSQVSCTFDTTLCGWVSNSSSPEFYWTVKGGEAHFDTSYAVFSNPQRRATLRSPVICGPQDCRTLRLEFDYRFSDKDGGQLHVYYLGQNNLHVRKIPEEDDKTHRSENNISLVNRGHFQIAITGDIDKSEIVGSDIFLDNLSLRYLDCVTTSVTPDREVMTKSADTVNCSAYTVFTSTETSTTTIATEGDDSEADPVDSDFTAKKDEGGGNQRAQTTIIISACVGSGIVLAGVVVTVIIFSRRRSGQNRDLSVEGARTAGARHSSLMMENELYLCMTHSGDPASSDSTHANGGTLEMKELQPSRLSPTMTLVKSQSASNYYSTLSEDDEITHNHTTTADKVPDARETTLPNIKRLQVVSLDVAQEQTYTKHDTLSPGNHSGPCEIFHAQSGEGEPAAADHEYASVKEDDDDDEPDDDGDDDDERLRPEDHYDLIHESSSGRHVYSNEAGSFDGASVMTLRSQDNVFASAAVGGDDEPQQENVYDAIASS